MDVTTFSFPTTIHFGCGSRSLVAEALADRDLSRPLVVTDAALAELPALSELIDHLARARLAVGTFTGVAGNPTRSQVIAAAESYAAHDADAVVALGGGASIDVAKAVLVAHTQPGDLFDYEDGPEASVIHGPLPCLFALPTTAGTGSEVGRSAVIADDETHLKRIIFSPLLMPDEVFADPELTVGLPPHLTAATGFDALSHNVEAYLSPEYHPICDGVALEGVRLVARNLVPAVSDGSDLEARRGMLMASMMGAIAFQKGLGIVHSCAHALGAVADIHHGLANALMIDHALAFNVEGAAERLTCLAELVGAVKADPLGFLAWLRALKEEVGVAATLTDHGVDPGLLDRLVEIAAADPCHLSNPRPVRSEDLCRVFQVAFG